MRTAVCILVLLILPTTSLSAVIHVPVDYPTIQEAIDAAVDGDTVLVAPGTYGENIHFKGKAVAVRSESGPYSTIIDGLGMGSVVYFDGGEGPDSVLEGFTVMNGSAQYEDKGGGIYCAHSSPTIIRNVIEKNFNQSGTACCAFGGGVYVEGGAPTIAENLIRDNIVKAYEWYYDTWAFGGGIYVKDSNAWIGNNIIVDNQVEATSLGMAPRAYGGGIYVVDSNACIENNVIANNRVDAIPTTTQTEAHGGGICCHDYSSYKSIITNNTIVNNYFKSTAGLGSGIYTTGGNDLVANSIVYYNYPGPQIENATVVFSDVMDGYPGTGNIDADPLLSADFHLSSGSPCIDAGTTDIASLPPVDYEGDPRCMDGDGDFIPDVDMGADEYAPFKVPSTHLSIQQAINAAWDYAVVLVEPGTYQENIDFLGKPITLMSCKGSGETVIDGGGAGCVVTFMSGEGPDSVLKGFTITNGKGEDQPNYTGGGITCIGSSPSISDNVVIDNSASYAGAGFCCLNNANPLIAGNQILQNKAEFYGGGVFCYQSIPKIRGNTVSENSTLYPGGIGGGIACWNCDPRIEDNWIESNAVEAYGAGIGCWYSSAVIVNNIIYSNSANISGGGIGCMESSPFMTNNTLYANSAALAGGGVYCHENAAPVITNTILWNNVAPSDPEVHGKVPVVTFCDVKGGWPGSGNIDKYPDFLDPQNKNFHISMESPCFDKGYDSAPELPDHDYDGDLRIHYEHVDIGADEFCLPHGKVLQVPAEYASIQEALNKAEDGDLILVAPGGYTENLNFMGKAVTVRSDMDGMLETYDIAPEYTVIDGNQSGSVAVFISSEENDSVLDGFTLTNGNGTTLGFVKYGGGIYCEGGSPTIKNNIIMNNGKSGEPHTGGGVYCQNEAAPLIMNNTIKNNWAKSTGGGIACDGSAPFINGNCIESNEGQSRGGGIGCVNGSAPLIVDCSISANDSVWHGAGIFSEDSSPEILQNEITGNDSHFGGGIYCTGDLSPNISYNLIENNSVDYSGGGICCWENTAVIEGNVVSGNFAKGDSQYAGGGGIYCRQCSPKILNNIVINNSTEDSGGGICCQKTTAPEMTSNTIWGNAALEKGGGIYCVGSNASTVSNSIIWNNSATNGPGLALGPKTVLDVGYSDLEGGSSSVYVYPNSQLNWGAGMIDSDPLFVDTAQGDFHILHPSPCRDAGSGGPPEDFEGDPRIIPDMGADEFYAHLYYTGDAVPGASIEIKLTGIPGTLQVGFWIGTAIFDPPLSTPLGDWYLKFPVIGPVILPPMPGNGLNVLPGTIPAIPPGPYTLYLQALIGKQLTNLLCMQIQ